MFQKYISISNSEIQKVYFSLSKYHVKCKCQMQIALKIDILCRSSALNIRCSPYPIRYSIRAEVVERELRSLKFGNSDFSKICINKMEI